jgi:conjugal transfer mating pair stabilization protein TraN
MKTILMLIAGFLLGGWGQTQAQTWDLNTCTRLSQDVCIDNTPCKTFNGVTACLTGQVAPPGAAVVPNTCWAYEARYQCADPDFPNHCAPIQAEPLCAQVGADNCLAYNPQGQCVAFQATFRCTRDMGDVSNVTVVEQGYNVTRDYLDESACDGFRRSPVCQRQSSECVDSADRVISGLPFSRACWRYVDTYTCAGSVNNECQPYIDQGCRLVRQVCRETLADGTCAMEDHYYDCGSGPPPPPGTSPTCDTAPYCINGICYDTSRPADQDFTRSVAMMELAREAGAYLDPATLKVFNGTASKCVRQLFGLVNCCKAGGGGQADWKNSAFFTAMSFGRRYIGSSYMFDSLFMSDAPNYLISGLESLGVVNAAGSNSFSAYGITFGFEAGGGISVTGFDPTTFAISIAVQLILSELLSCDQQSQLTAVKRAQGICEPIGSYCSTNSVFGCYERTESFCCFNSKLAKAITVQGRQQLGLGLGTPQAPDCDGLTVEQLTSLDFSRIDLTEFINSITANAVSSATAQENVINAITRRSGQ